MMQLGEKQLLKVVKKVEFGVYLGEEDSEERVLLPIKQVPENIQVGDGLEVFLYKDSKDRLIATTREPAVTLGQIAKLPVKEVTKIGAFLDWGLEKDLFLPFKQQTHRVHPGEECLVGLYTDKSGRLCATMNVYEYLRQDSPYAKDDHVTGTIYQISKNFGAFVAVDDQFSGLVPAREFFGQAQIGDQVQAGEVAGYVDGVPMVCTIDGVLRGLLADGIPVHKGMKSGDIDPRCSVDHCFCASDKALAVGGGVLEAVLHLSGALEN